MKRSASNSFIKSVLFIPFLILTALLSSIYAHVYFGTEWSIDDAGFLGLHKGEKVYWLLDALTQTDEQIFFSEEYSIKNYEMYINKLEESELFSYCIYGGQPMYVDVDETETLMAHVVNKETLDMYPYTLSEGEAFYPDDFHFTKGSAIPILVGNDLKEKYPIGTVIKATFMCTELDFVVKGILTKDTYFPFHDNWDDEDGRVLIPTLHFDEESRVGYEFLIKALCLQNSSGFIVVEQGKTFEEILKYIDSLCRDLDLFRIRFARIDAFTLFCMRCKQSELYSWIQLVGAAFLISRWILIGFYSQKIYKKRPIWLGIIAYVADLFVVYLIGKHLLAWTYISVSVTEYFVTETLLAVLVFLIMMRRTRI